jgi:nicotinamidase-related amidase
MPARNRDLHGNVPDEAAAALLLIDVINDLEFEGGDALLGEALPMGERLAALAQRARRAGLPVVYVNDNFGKWRSDFSKLLDHCLHDGVRGQKLAELLRPDGDDYFVLKPKHSGFFATTLDVLLRYLGVTTVVLTGLTADNCVLFTASDAFLRDYHLVVPPDCVASENAEQTRRALEHMQRVLKARLTPSADLDLEQLTRRAA